MFVVTGLGLYNKASGNVPINCIFLTRRQDISSCVCVLPKLGVFKSTSGHFLAVFEATEVHIFHKVSGHLQPSLLGKQWDIFQLGQLGFAGTKLCISEHMNTTVTCHHIF